MESRPKRSLDEADPRSSDVEAAERAAGAVMCENRDLGMKWPYWHTLVFSNEITIEMRHVCPKDVRKMLVQRTRSVNWKKWAAKHEYEELKEGAWLEPELALSRKKVKENWTEMHRNVARKTLSESQWKRENIRMKTWESEMHQSSGMQVEGFRGHVATGGSPLGNV